jgi:kynurenine formamidase
MWTPRPILSKTVPAVEQLPLEILIGPVTVVELIEAEIITPELLEAQALAPETKRLLFKTKNSALWTDPGDQFNPDFVALSSESASLRVFSNKF